MIASWIVSLLVHAALPAWYLLCQRIDPVPGYRALRRAVDVGCVLLGINLLFSPLYTSQEVLERRLPGGSNTNITLLLDTCTILAIALTTLPLVNAAVKREMLCYRERLMKHVAEAGDAGEAQQEDERGALQSLLENSRVWSALHAAWAVMFTSLVCSRTIEVVALPDRLSLGQLYAASIPGYASFLAFYVAVSIVGSLVAIDGSEGIDEFQDHDTRLIAIDYVVWLIHPLYPLMWRKGAPPVEWWEETRRVMQRNGKGGARYAAEVEDADSSLPQMLEA